MKRRSGGSTLKSQKTTVEEKDTRKFFEDLRDKNKKVAVGKAAAGPAKKLLNKGELTNGNDNKSGSRNDALQALKEKHSKGGTQESSNNNS